MFYMNYEYDLNDKIHEKHESNSENGIFWYVVIKI